MAVLFKISWWTRGGFSGRPFRNRPLLYTILVCADIHYWRDNLRHDFQPSAFQAPVRKILKLGGLIFPLGLFWFTKSGVTNVVAWLFAILLIFDFIRLLVPRLNLKYLELGFLAKRKETKFLSGYTLFLAGTLVVLKYFSSEIAIFIMSAFIVSDVLAPAGKQAFLPIRFIKEKTIGGAIVVFTGAVLAGIFYKRGT